MKYSANQVVAANLGIARASKGWTQEEAARHLAPFLGEEWSKATYSAAERSAVRFDRIRQFSADDLVAFAAAFELPVQFFFIPPAWMSAPDYGVVAGDPDTCHAFDLGEYMRVVYGSPAAIDQLWQDLREAIEESAGEWNDDDSKAIRDALTVFTKARLRVVEDDILKMGDTLTQISYFLGDLAEAMGETRRTTIASFLDRSAGANDSQNDDVVKDDLQEDDAPAPDAPANQ